MDEKKKRVIVLEDEPSTLEYFEVMLESLGYEVESYTSPVLCPLYSDKYNCDLLLTDNKMPGMTGIEFIRHLHNNGRSIPMTALVTGSWNESVEKEIEELGCRLFRKPLEFDVIENWLEEAGEIFRKARQNNA